MKKNIKLSTLVFGNLQYKNKDYISAYDLINNYLTDYYNSFEKLQDVSITESLTKNLNDGLSGRLNVLNNLNINASIFSKSNEKLLSLVFNCNSIEKPALCGVKVDNEAYSDTGTIELFKGIILDDVIKLAKSSKQFINDFDRSHNGLYSVNSNFYLYLVDKEAILFPGNYSYMTITYDKNNGLSVDCQYLDIYIQAGLSGHEDNLLKNIYFNINDAPKFLQEKLFEIRRKQLNDEQTIIDEEKPLSKIRSIFKNQR